MIKEIALKYDDLELYKLASILEKDGAVNPMQMAIGKTMNPEQGLHYNLATDAVAAAKKDPSKLGVMRQRLQGLKKTGPLRLDDAVKAGISSALKKPLPKAEILPFVGKLKSLALKAK
jgi:hypothetical protein